MRHRRQAPECGRSYIIRSEAVASENHHREEKLTQLTISDVVAYGAKLNGVVSTNGLAMFGKRVQFIGTGPYVNDDLACLLPDGASVIDEQSTEPADWIILGREGLTVVNLENATLRNSSSTSYLSQEGFLDLILFGNDWWKVLTSRLNTEALNHPGLSFLKTLASFKWPGTDAVEASGSSGDQEYAQTSALRDLGYHTRLSAPRRWAVLEVAVPKLGLSNVAGHIAAITKQRKRQRGGAHRFRVAIAKWEADLEKLKETYYRGGFYWPSTYVAAS